MACVVKGGGATLTFSGIASGIGRLRNIGFYSETGSAVDNTDLSDSYVKMCPGDLTDFGSVTATVLYDDEAITGWGEGPIHEKGTLTIGFGDGTSQVQGEAFILSKAVGDHVNNQEVVVNWTFMWTADASVPTLGPVTP